jgi:hypothetical protein
MKPVRRRSVLEVRLGADGATSVHGLAQDTAREAVVDVDVRLDVAGDGTLLAVHGLAEYSPLVGQSTGSGFRRRLADLPRDDARLRLAYRLLDDLPILLRVAFQTTILDHPALTRPRAAMSLAGADQCEGWRADGTMLAQIAAEGGILQMALTDPVDDSDGAWGIGETPLPPMATRRRRRVDVIDSDGVLGVEAHFRDSYADPDGIERGLHGYTVHARVESGKVAAVEATGVVLPWPECWRATDSAARLVGLPLSEVDALVKTGFVGRGTCTHLNDTLRALVDVAELMDLRPSDATVLELSDPRTR